MSPHADDDPNPEFDAIHPSGTAMFRSCDAGILHSVVLDDQVGKTTAQALSEGLLRAAKVSYAKKDARLYDRLVVEQPDVPPENTLNRQDLNEALIALNAHHFPMIDQ